jgi:mannose-1-phosphate guanylyltransferase/mannose-6-phosphate isomerase
MLSAETTIDFYEMGDAMSNLIVPVILCGGSGTRLWPASRENRPKQFLKLIDDRSLLQNTVQRALRVSGAEADKVVTVTLGALKKGVAEQLGEIDKQAAVHILCEPSARNTAAAVALAALHAASRFGEKAMLWVLPADHHMGDEQALSEAFQIGLRAAEQGSLVTFGIQPARPDTGFGYIRSGDAFGKGAAFHIAEFVEKPDLATAQSYLDAGTYLWNSGMFLFSAEAVLNQFETHAPAILAATRRAIEAGTHEAPDSALYAAIPSQPFDKAIMEKTSDGIVVPCDPVWSDIGSWHSLWEMRAQDAHGNVAESGAILIDSRNCLVQADKRLVACAGVENLVIIDTGDALLVADRANADAMRNLVKALKEKGRQELIDLVTE